MPLGAFADSWDKSVAVPVLQLVQGAPNLNGPFLKCLIKDKSSPKGTKLWLIDFFTLVQSMRICSIGSS